LSHDYKDNQFDIEVYFSDFYSGGEIYGIKLNDYLKVVEG